MNIPLQHLVFQDVLLDQICSQGQWLLQEHLLSSLVIPESEPHYHKTKYLNYDASNTLALITKFQI